MECEEISKPLPEHEGGEGKEKKEEKYQEEKG